MIKIVLAGNPNCGKSTVFNALTGARQSIGNWPGVTVEKKESMVRNERSVSVVDLPGIYSLAAFTPEEMIARNYIFGGGADVILNIVDGSSLERSLYLTLQLIETGVPVVVAVNMMDIVEKSGDLVDIKHLSTELGVPVVPMSAGKGTGLNIAVAEAKSAVHRDFNNRNIYSYETARLINEIKKYCKNTDEPRKTWYAIKLLERDTEAAKWLKSTSAEREKIEKIIAAAERKAGMTPEESIISEKYDRIVRILEGCCIKGERKVTVSEKIDSIIMGRLTALPFFAVIMFFMYFLSIFVVGNIFGRMSVAPLKCAAQDVLLTVGCSEWLRELITDGIITGVGAVLGFLPQLFVLFISISILEMCGYMARVAFIMDRLFRKIGLSGKSFIPLILGTGCSVPGIMTARTIECERERQLTVMSVCFIPCSAKLPVISLISGTVLGLEWWASAGAYFAGISAVIVSGLILKGKRNEASGAALIMEMPDYHLPKIGSVLRNAWHRAAAFLKKAGSVIFLASIILWFGANFGIRGGIIRTNMDESLLCALGKAVSPVFMPLGWGRWETTVATLSGFFAKENIVSTLNILCGEACFSKAEGLSFLMFNLLCAPCVAAIGAMRHELGSVKLTLFTVCYQTLFAYCTSALIYGIAEFVQLGSVSFLIIPASVFFTVILFKFAVLSKKREKRGILHNFNN